MQSASSTAVPRLTPPVLTLYSLILPVMSPIRLSSHAFQYSCSRCFRRLLFPGLRVLQWNPDSEGRALPKP